MQRKMKYNNNNKDIASASITTAIILLLLSSISFIESSSSSSSSIASVGGGLRSSSNSRNVQDVILRDEVSSSSSCPVRMTEYGKDRCDVDLEDKKVCSYEYIYKGGCGDDDEIECVPNVECTCNFLYDGMWACKIDAYSPTCNDGSSPNDPDGIRGTACIPNLLEGNGNNDIQVSETMIIDNYDAPEEIDVNSIPQEAAATDTTTTTNPDDDGVIVAVGAVEGDEEAPQPSVFPPSPTAATSLNDEDCASNGVGNVCYEATRSTIVCCTSSLTGADFNACCNRGYEFGSGMLANKEPMISQNFFAGSMDVSIPVQYKEFKTTIDEIPVDCVVNDIGVGCKNLMVDEPLSALDFSSLNVDGPCYKVSYGEACKTTPFKETTGTCYNRLDGTFPVCCPPGATGTYTPGDSCEVTLVPDFINKETSTAEEDESVAVAAVTTTTTPVPTYTNGDNNVDENNNLVAVEVSAMEAEETPPVVDEEVSVVAAAAESSNNPNAIPIEFYGLNYNTRKGPDWAADMERCKSRAEVVRDLTLLSRVTNKIRLLSLEDCDQGRLVWSVLNDELLSVAPDMKMWLGLWVGPDPYVFQQELNALESILKDTDANWDYSHLLGITVGSEAVYREDVTIEEAINNMLETKALLSKYDVNVPTTIVEIAPIYSNSQQLRMVVDVIMTNTFPFWEGQPIENAVNDLDEDLSWLANLPESQNKPFVLSEHGWPSDGYIEGVGVASPENQLRYVHESFCYLRERNMPYYLFTSIDNDWRQIQDPMNTIEGNWGFLKSDLSLKDHFKNYEFDCGDGVIHSFANVDWSVPSIDANDVDRSNASCQLWSGCTELSGDCCPTPNNDYLGCCRQENFLGGSVPVVDPIPPPEQPETETTTTAAPTATTAVIATPQPTTSIAATTSVSPSNPPVVPQTTTAAPTITADVVVVPQTTPSPTTTTDTIITTTPAPSMMTEPIVEANPSSSPPVADAVTTTTPVAAVTTASPTATATTNTLVGVNGNDDNDDDNHNNNDDEKLPITINTINPTILVDQQQTTDDRPTSSPTTTATTTTEARPAPSSSSSNANNNNNTTEDTLSPTSSYEDPPWRNEDDQVIASIEESTAAADESGGTIITVSAAFVAAVVIAATTIAA